MCPGATDDPTFMFAPDTTLYNISEARSFNIIGFKADYLFKSSERFSVKGGVDLSKHHRHRGLHHLGRQRPLRPVLELAAQGQRRGGVPTVGDSAE